MRLLLLLTFCITGITLHAQEEYHFTINPNIDTLEHPNPILIRNLEQFLRTKNNDLAANALWDSTDFAKHKYPYKSIYWVETGWPKKYHYYPTLIAIVPTETENQYILKLAFMESQHENSVFLKMIYNIIASVKNDEVTFSRYTSYATENWHEKTVGSITYISSPSRAFSTVDARKQEEFTKYLSEFFEIAQIPITYFSCVNSEEMFNIQGYDYNWQMHLHKTAGQTGFNNTVYSGNDRDIYNHEVVHIYLAQSLDKKWNPLLNEGIATYMGGSGELNYKEHRSNLARYIAENPDFDFTEHLNPYEQLFIFEDTSVPYTMGALICEIAHEQGGKELLLKVVAEADNSSAFQLLNISMENLNDKLRSQLRKEPHLLALPE